MFSVSASLCNQSLETGRFSAGIVTMSAASNAATYCVTKLYTGDVSFRFRITFNRSINNDINNINRDAVGCDSKDYIHIGNNMNYIDIESLTSYKFCGHLQNIEVVTRGPHSWVVFSATQPEQFVFKYEVLPEGNNILYYVHV